MHIWNREQECMLHSRLRELQLGRLRECVAHCAANVKPYQDRLRAAKVSAQDIRSLEDVRRLPFTTKADLEDAYPAGMLGVAAAEVICTHTFSGHDDRLCVSAYTRRDLETWSNVTARLLSMAGVTRESNVQVAFGHGLLPEAFGLHQGVERIGAHLIPASLGDTRRQVHVLRDLGTTHLACTPTYALQVIAAAAELGVKFGRTRLQAAIVGGETCSEPTRLRIESHIGAKVYDHYGPGEIMNAGIAAECRVRDGLHVFEDHFLVEVVDPESGEPVPEDAAGEIVVTTLTREASPVLRYRTGDIASITRHPCDCGRTFMRMSRVTGRTDDMLVIRGVNVFPSQIEHALFEAAGRVPHYQIVVGHEELAEDLELKIEVTEDLLSDEMKNLRRLEADLRGHLRRLLALTSKVTFVEPRTLPAAETSAERVVDHGKG